MSRPICARHKCGKTPQPICGISVQTCACGCGRNYCPGCGMLDDHFAKSGPGIPIMVKIYPSDFKYTKNTKIDKIPAAPVAQWVPTLSCSPGTTDQTDEVVAYAFGLASNQVIQREPFVIIRHPQVEFNAYIDKIVAEIGPTFHGWTVRVATDPKGRQQVYAFENLPAYHAAEWTNVIQGIKNAIARAGNIEFDGSMMSLAAVDAAVSTMIDTSLHIAEYGKIVVSRSIAVRPDVKTSAQAPVDLAAPALRYLGQNINDYAKDHPFYSGTVHRVKSETGLRVREKASFDAKVIDVLKDGEQVIAADTHVDAKSGVWIQHHLGWSLGYDGNQELLPAIVQELRTPQMHVVVCEAGVTIRDRPDPHGKTTGALLTSKTRVLVTARCGNWLRHRLGWSPFYNGGMEVLIVPET